MALICTGCGCQRSFKCGKCIHNLNLKYQDEVNTVENLATFGSSSISSNGVEENYLCGTNGRYNLFGDFFMV